MREDFQERTGIYRLGFAKESFLGLIIPILFVIIVGGIGIALLFVV